MTSVGEDVKGPYACLEGRGFSPSGRLLGVDLGGRLQDHFEGDYFPWESEGDAWEKLENSLLRSLAGL